MIKCKLSTKKSICGGYIATLTAIIPRGSCVLHQSFSCAVYPRQQDSEDQARAMAKRLVWELIA